MEDNIIALDDEIDAVNDDHGAKYEKKQLIELPLIEIPDVVLFPGETIPICFTNPSWISYIERQHATAQEEGGSEIRLGVLTKIPRRRPPSSTVDDGIAARRRHQRHSWFRQGRYGTTPTLQRISVLLNREFDPMFSDVVAAADSYSDDRENEDNVEVGGGEVNDAGGNIGNIGEDEHHVSSVDSGHNINDMEVSSSESEDVDAALLEATERDYLGVSSTAATSEEVERASQQQQQQRRRRQRPPLQQERRQQLHQQQMQQQQQIQQREQRHHPFVGRIGTIVCIISSTTTNNNTNNNEMLVTAISTSRFVVVSCLGDSDTDDDYNRYYEVSNPISFFIVENVHDQQFSLPPRLQQERCFSGLKSLNYNVNKDDSDDDKYECGQSSLLNSSFEAQKYRQENMIKNLTRVSSVPYIAYSKFWPWKLVIEIRHILERSSIFEGLKKNIPPLISGAYRNNKKSHINGTNNNSLEVLDPSPFSFYLAANMSLKLEEKLELLSMYSSVERLCYIKKKLLQQEKYKSIISCKFCLSGIARVSNIFVFGEDENNKTTGNHLNPHGIVHQIMTVRGLLSSARFFYSGNPETFNSYFPGYSWRCMGCAVCGEHLGWEFASVQQGNSEGCINESAAMNNENKCNNSNDFQSASSCHPRSFFSLLTSAVSIDGTISDNIDRGDDNTDE